MLVGEPVAVEDLLAEAAEGAWSEQRLQVAIADRVGKVRWRAAELVGGTRFLELPGNYGRGYAEATQVGAEPV